MPQFLGQTTSDIPAILVRTDEFVLLEHFSDFRHVGQVGIVEQVVIANICVCQAVHQFFDRTYVSFLSFIFETAYEALNDSEPLSADCSN